METYVLKGTTWKEMSILTASKIKGNSYEITGISKKELNPNDRIFIDKVRYYSIVEETERRNARGKWADGENNNNWFKALAEFKTVV